MHFFLYLCSEMKKVALYRVWSWLTHLLTAWNTGGEGVHSPYLFEWVRMVMSDKHVYYIWDDIEAVRAKMLQDKRKLQFVDYGSGRKTAGDMAKDERRVCEIAKGSLAKKKYAQMLFRLVNWLVTSHMSGTRGLNVLELGTSLGVTTAYLAAADSRNRVVTVEGCRAVASVANENWKTLGMRNIECHVEEITVDALRRITDGLQGVLDVVFLDANHTYVSTREYFDVLVDRAHKKSVFIIDDIHHTPEMECAWKAICADERVTSTIDLYQMGLVFFDRHYWKRHYKMRL